MKLKPLDDRLVVEEIKAAGVTKGGIVLPDGTQKRNSLGLVIAIGPGRLLDSGERAAMTVKPGDEVAYNEYAGAELEHDGSKVRILRESDVLGVMMK